MAYWILAYFAFGFCFGVLRERVAVWIEPDYTCDKDRRLWWQMTCTLICFPASVCFEDHLIRFTALAKTGGGIAYWVITAAFWPITFVWLVFMFLCWIVIMLSAAIWWIGRGIGWLFKNSPRIASRYCKPFEDAVRQTVGIPIKA